MKKAACTALFLLLLGAAGLFAADIAVEPPFLPPIPQVLAEGGSSVADAGGYSALFYNPAGFSAGPKSLTALSASSWLFADPLRFIRAVQRGGPGVTAGFVADEVTTGGFGFGAAAGIGYVGHGLGLGAVLAIDSYLYGPTTLEAQGYANATLGFVAGFAVPVELWGVKVHLGADLRPLLRVSAPVDYTTMLDILRAVQVGGDPLAPLASAEALYGYGFGIDMGTIVELGALRIGLAVRDLLGTTFSYTSTTVQAIRDSLDSGSGLPGGGGVVGGHMIPMSVAAGVSYHPDLGRAGRIVDPAVHLALDDLVGVIREERSVWTLLHCGAELRLLRAVTLRGGFQQGYLTFGAGIDLFFLEINAAVFTRELGNSVGNRPSSGAAVEAAIRF